MSFTEGKARKSLADIVFDHLLRAIKSGVFSPDERLPTEHELAAEFQVSRPIVREALRRLREQGLIYSRRGAGSFVRRVGLKQPLGFGRLENVADLLDCYEFRMTIEPAAAACAAERRDADSLAAIEGALAQIRDANNRQTQREEADFQFHMSIARAGENSFFSTAMEALKEHIAVGMRFHSIPTTRDDGIPGPTYAEHTRIYEAIRDGKCELARSLMHEHLSSARERLFERRRGGVAVAS